MSRATRPTRRVRGADRERLCDRLSRALGSGQRPLADLVRVDRHGGTWSARCARLLGTSPSIVRRMLLGRAVSARAARRLLG